MSNYCLSGIPYTTYGPLVVLPGGLNYTFYITWSSEAGQLFVVFSGISDYTTSNSTGSTYKHIVYISGGPILSGSNRKLTVTLAAITASILITYSVHTT